MKVLVPENTTNKSYKQKVIHSFSEGLSKHKDEATEMKVYGSLNYMVSNNF